LRIGANVGMTPDGCQWLVAKLCAAHSIADVPDIKTAITSYLANQPHLATVGHERSFIFRYYKPSELLFPGLGLRRFYFRQNNVKATSFAPKLAAGLGITAGINLERNAISAVTEKYYADSIWYFLQRYFHDFGNNHISNANSFHREGYWPSIRRQQKFSLEELFKKFATESESSSLMAQTDSLTVELNAIEMAFTRRKLSISDYQIITEARTEFDQAARSFKAETTSENYEAALMGFQKLMYSYCPHIRKMKANSLLYETMAFSLTDTV
jgi:hypothetical protein